MTTPRSIIDLIALLAHTLHTPQSAEVTHFAQAIDQTLAPLDQPPVLGRLAEVLAAGSHGPFCEQMPLIQAIAHLLPWTQFYRETELTRPFLAEFAIAQLVGPTGPIVAHDQLIVLFLLGPHTWYPIHHHAADEVYTIIAGHVQFLIDGTWIPRQAGEHQLVRPHVPHGLRTTDAPMLTFGTWIGDVRQPVFFTVEGQDIEVPLLPQYTAG